MNSCLYIGKIRHRRFTPRRHDFTYRLFMLYLDLAELDTVFQGRWLWSAGRRWALARFCREDHVGDPARPLADCVRELVERETGQRPQGPIRLLTHLRYLGLCFNPISIYYCFDKTGEKLENVVAEVTNTPWGERHCYVLTQRRQRFSKQMHVSPFMPVDLDYAWYCNEPDEQLSVHMNVLKADAKLFDATLSLRRQALSGPRLAQALAGFPLMTYQVLAAIHWEALRLWLKRVPLFDHPAKHRKTA